jgi:uncharacterized protein (TIGR03435 family)
VGCESFLDRPASRAEWDLPSFSALSVFILQAYNVKWYELVSLDWVIRGESESGYDVTAKIPLGTSRGDYKLMLQRLLANRFHLVVHRECTL